ncbi:conserved hypothetical protein [Rhodospirillaceae bacterium LM-1]|nr:conserved hypothetical protein [Rhodospirillaceae bacterium LM-1]
MADIREPIRARDDRGREIVIDRETWRKDVLLPNIEKDWNEPEALYGLILGGLDDGFVEDLLAAAQRLSEIDPVAERAACIHAIVLMQLKLYNEAEARLRAHIARYGEDGVVLTNLAKVFSFRGEESEAHRLLRRALTLDPNQDNALSWWCAIHHERGGDEAARQALEEIDAEPGSWRAKLELAGLCLKANDLEGALDFYRRTLELSRAPEVFHRISGDMGQAGYIAEMLALVEPLFDLDQHGAAAGLNLVRAYAEKGEAVKGRALWRRIKALGIPPYDEVLAELEGLLNKPEHLLAAAQSQGETDASRTPKDKQPLELMMTSVDGPIWTRGLDDAASWLMASCQEGLRLDILPLTIAPKDEQGQMPSMQIEDDEGRLSRALPLFLAEMLAFNATVRPRTLIPALIGKGPVVTSQDWPLDRLLVDFGRGGPVWLAMTGRMPVKGFAARLEIDIWNGATGEKLATVKQMARNGAAHAALQLAAKVQEALIAQGLAQPRQPPDWYEPPQETDQEGWLLALGQLLAQQHALNKLIPAELLWNEHGMFETHFRLAESAAGWTPAALLAACSLLAGLAYGSPVAGRYVKALERLLDRHDGKTDAVDRLAPLVRLRLKDQAGFQKAKERLASIDDPVYRLWLEKVG